jgi:hypothetical protein
MITESNPLLDPALAGLLARVSSALRQLPGAVELYLYGSSADPDLADAYSDLDLQVICEGFLASQVYWPGILTRAGEIELAFPIEATLQSAVYMIGFASESPYHKVDVGLSDAAQEHGFIQQIQAKKLLWRQPPSSALQSLHPGEIYIPTAGSAAYFMLGELLSAVRYLKARKRGQHLTAWRFLSAKFTALLRCRLWGGDPNTFPTGTLSTWDYVELDRQLAGEDRLALLANLNPAPPVEMDRSLVSLTHQIVQTIQPRLGAEDDPSIKPVQRYLAFIEHELFPDR